MRWTRSIIDLGPTTVWDWVSAVIFELLFRIHVKESAAASDKPCLEYVLVV